MENPSFSEAISSTTAGEMKFGKQFNDFRIKSDNEREQGVEMQVPNVSVGYEEDSFEQEQVELV